MKSFLLAIGNATGRALPTILSTLSCGAARPVTGLDICHITDREPDSLIPALIGDLDTDCSLFPSSFRFDAFRPQLPSLTDLSSDPASSVLIGALRGKGMPLSYKTDREAVEWAFSALLSRNDFSQSFSDWTGRIRSAVDAGEEVRLCFLSDLCDPFSAGALFALLRYLRNIIPVEKAFFCLLCLAKRSSPATELEERTFREAVQAMEDQQLVARPDRVDASPADACWLLSLPASLSQSEEAWRQVWVARRGPAYPGGSGHPNSAVARERGKVFCCFFPLCILASFRSVSRPAYLCGTPFLASLPCAEYARRSFQAPFPPGKRLCRAS